MTEDPSDKKTDIYEFISYYGFLTLSVATAVGISFNTFIQQFTQELLYPLLGILLNIKNIKSYYFTLKGVKINIGKVLMALLSYLILMAIIIFFAFYVFGDLTHKLRKIEVETNRKIYEQQEKTAQILEKIYRKPLAFNAL